MKITILTLFPEMFDGPFRESIIKRAQEKGLVEISLVNIRDFGIGTHKVVDDKPYGGGIGMVMKVDVLASAIDSVKDATLTKEQQRVILLDPRGETFVQKKARAFSRLEHLILLCGHYEGVDERVRNLVDETISIGDYVVTGGEIPAMMITDAVVRLVSGVLKDDATAHESFSIENIQRDQGVTEVERTEGSSLARQAWNDPRKVPAANSESDALFGGDDRQDPEVLLEYPQYTTPSSYNNMDVPDVLLSGNHAKIDAWRKNEALALTKKHRPDLLK